MSDLHLKYSGKSPKTWLDKYELQVLELEEKEQVFAAKEAELREKAIERGRNKVPVMVKNCLCPEFKKLEYDPYDIKAIMDPVDFIVFDGLNQGKQVQSVTFLAKPTNSQMCEVTKTIKTAVSKGSYDWKVARITTTGKVELT
jgi:Predicted secreted endonuclease distantly related to archaeal Holliday junction resolvase